MPAVHRFPDKKARGRLCLIAFTIPILSHFLLGGFHPALPHESEKQDPCVLLMKIYAEVLEMESPDAEELIKGEFLMELDGNEENKEEHVLVISHWSGDHKKIILQVTYFEPKSTRSIIKYAKTTKTISCQLKEEKIEIRECDYNESEMQTLLPDILHGIKKKKKLLKLIDHRNSCG